MNLARFGLYIDPAPAQAGAKATIAAAKSIKPALEDVAKAADTSGKSTAAMGAAAQAAGSKAAAGMKQAANETRKAGDAAKGATGNFDGLISKVMKLVSSLALAYAAFKGVQMGIGFVMDAIGKAAQMEGFQTRWAYLLGSFDAAKKKMAELAEFANTTPFDLPGVTQASLALAKLKKTGLETMDGLRLVGDAAALAGQPIEEVAQRIARLTNNLKRGGGGGDEVRILGEWQIFSPELVARIQEMGTKASNFKTLLSEIKGELGNAGGSMGLMATTWEGLISTMKDAWGAFKTAIGQPIMEGLKPLIGDLTTIIDRMKAGIVAMQPEIQRVVSYIPAAFRVLQTDGGLKLSLQAAWDYFSDLMRRTWEATGRYLAQLFAKVAYDFKQAMSDPAFWKGIADTFVTALTEAFKAISPFASRVVASWGAGGTVDDLDAQQKKEEERLRATYEMKNRLLEERGRIGNNGGPIDPATLPGFYGAPPGAADPSAAATGALGGMGIYSTPGAGAENDLPTASPGTYGPSLLDAPPPEPVFKMEDAKRTEAQTEFINRLDKQYGGLIAQSLDVIKKNEELVSGKKAARDAEEAKRLEDEANGIRGGQLFPGGFPREDDGSDAKDALLPGTDMGYNEAEKEAEALVQKNMTAAEVHQQELTRVAAMREAKLLAEGDYQRAVEKSKETFTAAKAAEAEAAKAAMEKQQSGIQKLMAQWGDLKTNIDGANVAIMQSIEGNITGGLVAMMEGTKSASEAFADMAKGIVSSILQIVTKLLVQYALMAAMGMATGGFTSFAAGALSGGVKHAGGDVGGEGPTRSLPSAVFGAARRYHEGGAIMGPDEVPIVAQQGETVLTKDQANDIKARLGEKKESSEGKGVTVINYQDPREVATYLATNPDSVLNVIGKNAGQVRKILQVKG